MIGRVLDGYRVTALLGRGGMGEVWRAEDTADADREVALKLIAANRERSASAVERLRREGSVLAALRHRGIARIHRVGECEGVHYIAMELIEGETLGARLTRGALAPDEARRVVREAADALAYAHARGVLHRDLTTNNLMLESTGRVVVLDFGLALIEGRSRLTSSGALVGTPHFLAPEVIRNHEPDARSDVYSLGVVLYEAVTGSLPFGDGRAEQAYWAALHEKAEPPSRRRPGLPREWDDLVLRAIAREPGLRWQSAEEFGRAMDALGEAKSDETTATLGGGTGPGARTLRIAVLPFTDMTATPQSAAIADGLADAIGAALGRYPGLQIVPAVTTRELAREGVRRVAREFDADHVVSGTLLRIDDRMRVTCSLVDGRKASQALAETLEGALRELPDIERQIVNAIAVELRLAVPRRQESTPADPLSGENFLQARSYLRRSDSEAAVDGAMRLLEPLSQQPDATSLVWAELSRAYRHKHHLTRDRAWVERAVNAADHALALDPASGPALVAAGRGHLLLGRYEEAERCLREASERRPDMREPHLGLAMLHHERGDLDQAELDIRTCIAIAPGDWGDYNLLGSILYRKGRYVDAIEAWRQVVRLTPDNPRPYFNMGAALFQLGRVDEAEQAYRDSLERQRTSGALAGLGTILYRRGDLASATEAFESATQLSPGDPITWGNLAAALRWQPEQTQRARHALERAATLAREQLTVNPRRAELMANLASWTALLGDFDAARTWIARALEVNPRDPHTLLHAVQVHDHCGERGRALQYLEEAVLHGCSWAEFESDRELDSLRDSPEYRKLRSRLTPRENEGGSSSRSAPRPEVES